MANVKHEEIYRNFCIQPPGHNCFPNVNEGGLKRPGGLTLNYVLVQVDLYATWILVYLLSVQI